MDDDFSFIELLLMRKLVKSNTAEEIALLMDKPLNSITSFIDNNKLIAKTRKKHALPAKKKAAIEKEKKDLKKIAQLKQEQIYEQQRKNRRQQPEFKTKKVDYSNQILVKIDHKTFVYVEPGTDIEQFKKDYIARLKKAQEAHVKQYTEVKKFKPIE